MKGFWNDPDGLTIDEFAALTVLPLFLFVGVKLALAKDISSTQVDFFIVLTYPILAVVARRAIENFGWPALGRRGQVTTYQTPSYGSNSYYQPPADISRGIQVQSENQSKEILPADDLGGDNRA